MQTKLIDPFGPPNPARIRNGCAAEYKLIRTSETPLRESYVCDTPDRLAAFWAEAITNHPAWDPDREMCYCFHLNTRRHLVGYHLIASGTLDTLLVHPREVFRVPIVCAAAAVIVAHNHPSGDPTPGEADIKVTRDLIRAGQLLKIELLDHIVIGRSTAERTKGFCSLRELGYFYV